MIRQPGFVDSFYVVNRLLEPVRNVLGHDVIRSHNEALFRMFAQEDQSLLHS